MSPIELTHLYNSLKSVFQLLPLVSDPRSFVIDHLEKVSTTDAFSYFYTLLVLKKLYAPSQETFSYSFKCLFMELLDFMSEIQSAQLLSLHIYFDQSLASDVVQSLSNIMSLPSDKNVTGSDVLKLMKAYDKKSTPLDPSTPSVEYLRHVRIFEALVRDSFGPNPSSGHLRREKLMLLSIASCRYELKTEDGWILHDEHVDSASKSLLNLYQLTQKITSMSQIHDHFYSFLDFIPLPVASACLITWFTHQFQNPNFYEWTSFLVSPPLAFPLLDEIAYAHPLLHSQLIKLWIDLMHRPFESKEIKPVVAIQYKEQFMDHLVLIARLGSVWTILQNFLSNPSQLDHSLILYFLGKYLDNVESPYPQELIGTILDVLLMMQPLDIRAHEQYSAIQTFLVESNQGIDDLSFETRDKLQQVQTHINSS